MFSFFLVYNLQFLKTISFSARILLKLLSATQLLLQMQVAYGGWRHYVELQFLLNYFWMN